MNMPPKKNQIDNQSVQLFPTCLIDNFYPATGLSVLRILKKLGFDISLPADQICYGQPAFNSGFREQAKKVANS